MASYTTEEGWHTLPDGFKVYTKLWKPTTPPVAVLLLVHGFSDHINSYYSLFPILASRSIQVHGFDQRGWGRSVQKPAERGLTGSTFTVLNDITSVLKTLVSTASSISVPLFLMGHSMGGAEVLTWAARGPPEVRSQICGFLLESPYIALHPSTQPNRITVIGGKMVAKVLPRHQMVQKVQPKWVSRDPAVCKEYEEDKLCHDIGTLEGLVGMLERADELDKGVVTVKEGDEEIDGVRIWVGHGSADHVCSFNAAQRCFERLAVKDKEFKTYEGWYHKLHAEPGEDKITFANDVANWILTKTRTAASRDSAEGRSKL